MTDPPPHIVVVAAHVHILKNIAKEHIKVTQ